MAAKRADIPLWRYLMHQDQTGNVGKPAADVTKRDTFWAEYHLGLSNGSNGKADNNTSKDLYGRWVMRYYNQSLGFFTYRSPDTYDDSLRTFASISRATACARSTTTSSTKTRGHACPRAGRM